MQLIAHVTMFEFFAGIVVVVPAGADRYAEAMRWPPSRGQVMPPTARLYTSLPDGCQPAY
jgi:hypothetical protein